MKIVEVNGNKYIDQQLFDYINNIWLNYDIEIDNDSNIYFAKNTTVNRLITDYTGKNISRVIKKEKADYVIINKMALSDYPQFYDGVHITQDDSKEVVYGIYNLSLENQDVIELILDFVNRGQNVKYVNQNKLNESLNNGFTIDKENYITIKELIDSEHPDNHVLAINMLTQSDLKSNWEWILYLYHGKTGQFTHDKKNIIRNYIDALNLGYRYMDLFNKVDYPLKIVKNQDIKDRFVYLVKQKFQNEIKNYLRGTLGTEVFDLQDFKLKCNV